MILRKPYAFFIKNFRLMHLIMTVILGYLMFRTYDILDFFNKYLSSNTSFIGRELTDPLFNIFMFIGPVIMIITSTIVMVVLNQKKKPYKFYIINIAVSIFVIAFYYYNLDTVSQLEVRELDIRLIRGIRDFVFALLVTQIGSVLITFARASGFDVKKFDFKKDLQALEIKEDDREEFEVNINVDFNKITRKFRRLIRYSKYIYKENVFICNVVILMVVAIFGTIYLIDKNVYNKTYSNHEFFDTPNYKMRVLDVYSTTTDNKGTRITKENMSLVIVKLEVRRKFKKEITLNTAETALKLGSKRYYPTDEYRDKIDDLGTPYFKQIVSDSFTKYMLVYEVPTKNLNRKMEFNYVKTVATAKLEPNIIHITIAPIDLDKDKEVAIVKLEEENKLNDSLYKDTILNIKSYEISDTFINDYKFCHNKICYNSKEFIKPILNTNFDKTLLKLDLNYVYDNNSDMVSNNFKKLVDNYLTLEYKVNDNSYTQAIGLNVLQNNKTSNNNIYYLEVNKQVKESNELKLVFKIRNKTYKYLIRSSES